MPHYDELHLTSIKVPSVPLLEVLSVSLLEVPNVPLLEVQSVPLLEVLSVSLLEMVPDLIRYPDGQDYDVRMDETTMLGRIRL